MVAPGEVLTGVGAAVQDRSLLREGTDSKVVAAQLNCAEATVGKWRRRFVAERLDGLVDKPRPGRPPSISIEAVEQVVVATLEETPKNATHWSRASMAKRSGLSKTTIGRIWKAFELKPHRVDGFKLSKDPLFAREGLRRCVAGLAGAHEFDALRPEVPLRVGSQ